MQDQTWLVLSAYSKYDNQANQDVLFEVKLYNQGNKVAEMCQITFDPNTNDKVAGIESTVFSVAPQQDYIIQMELVTYDKPETYECSAVVYSKNNPLTEPMGYSILIR